MEIWVVRHGETVENLQGIIQGHRPGKLSENGILQAKFTGPVLTKQRFKHIYVSDLGRTVETYEAMGFGFRKHKPPVTFTSLLREKGGGILEGAEMSKWDQFAALSGKDPREFHPSEGESWEIVMHRADAFLTYLIDTVLRSKKVDLQAIEKSFEIKKHVIPHESQTNEPQKINIDAAEQKEERLIQEQPKKDDEKQNNMEALQIQGSPNEENAGLINSKQAKKSSALSFFKKFFCCKCLSSEETSSTRSPPKILVITHGGFVMELFNAIAWRQDKRKPVLRNDTLNCSINVIKVTLGRNGKENFKVIRKNDVSHLQGKLP